MFAAYNASVLLPEIVLTVFAMIVLLAGAFLGYETQKRALPFLALLGVGISCAATASLWDDNGVFGPTQTAIYGADNFSLFFKWIFLIGLGVSVLLSGRFLEARSGDKGGVGGEYLGLMMFATVGMMMVAGARDLLVIFLGIETLSIALYVLAGFARTRLMSNEAALKYFLLGAFASGFLLYGIALVYYSLGSTHLPTIARVLEVDGGARSTVVTLIGVALLLIGLGFKAALVPFHQWTPDVYEGSPTPVTAFMATGAKSAAFAALMRVFGDAFVGLAPQTHSFLLVLAVLTMTVGNIVAITQNSMKRMLAYSSIAHAGYLLIGVLAATTASYSKQPEGAARATAGVLFYLLCYALMNLGAFAVLIYLEARRGTRLVQDAPRVEGIVSVTAQRGGEDSEDGNLQIGDLNGLAWREPFLAAALTLFLLSLAGIPPLAGFFGKLTIFTEAIGQGLWGLVLIGAINTVISIYYYLRPVVAMYSGNELDANISDELRPSFVGDATVAAPLARSLPVGALVAVVICGVGVLAMFALQSATLQWAQEAATSFVRR